MQDIHHQRVSPCTGCRVRLFSLPHDVAGAAASTSSGTVTELVSRAFCSFGDYFWPALVVWAFDRVLRAALGARPRARDPARGEEAPSTTVMRMRTGGGPPSSAFKLGSQVGKPAKASRAGFPPARPSTFWLLRDVLAFSFSFSLGGHGRAACGRGSAGAFSPSGRWRPACGEPRAVARGWVR